MLLHSLAVLLRGRPVDLLRVEGVALERGIERLGSLLRVRAHRLHVGGARLGIVLRDEPFDRLLLRRIEIELLRHFLELALRAVAVLVVRALGLVLRRTLVARSVLRARRRDDRLPLRGVERLVERGERVGLLVLVRLHRLRHRRLARVDLRLIDLARADAGDERVVEVFHLLRRTRVIGLHRVGDLVERRLLIVLQRLLARRREERADGAPGVRLHDRSRRFGGGRGLRGARGGRERRHDRRRVARRGRRGVGRRAGSARRVAGEREGEREREEEQSTGFHGPHHGAMATCTRAPRTESHPNSDDASFSEDERASMSLFPTTPRARAPLDTCSSCTCRIRTRPRRRERSTRSCVRRRGSRRAGRCTRSRRSRRREGRRAARRRG